MKTTFSAFTGYSPLLSSLAVASVAFIALGVVYLMNAVAEESDDSDTTTRLLSGGNRARILAALERDRNRQFVAHELIEVA